MASLGKFLHRSRNTTTGEFYDFSGDVSVSKDGIFRIVVTDNELATVIEAQGSPAIRIKRGREFFGVYSSDLEQAKHAIIQGITAYLQPQTNIEYVIVYNIGSRWTAWVNPETGEFWGNGGVKGCAPRPPADWDGQGGLSATNSVAGFSFMVGAQVYRKEIHIRGAHKKISYHRADSSCDSECVGPVGLELASYSCWPDVEMRDSTEIPYTEEAAAFFLGLIKAIIKLGLLTKPYLDTKEGVSTAIEQYAAGKIALPGESYDHK